MALCRGKRYIALSHLTPEREASINDSIERLKKETGMYLDELFEEALLALEEKARTQEFQKYIEGRDDLVRRRYRRRLKEAFR